MPVTRTFTLVACDSERFQIDPALLIKHSSIFADMLSTIHQISPDTKQECTLTEDAETVAAFVEALADKREPDTSGAWIGLYGMVDKYDCPELLPMLQLGGWCVQLSFLYFAKVLTLVLRPQVVLPSGSVPGILRWDPHGRPATRLGCKSILPQVRSWFRRAYQAWSGFRDSSGCCSGTSGAFRSYFAPFSRAEFDLLDPTARPP